MNVEDNKVLISKSVTKPMANNSRRYIPYILTTLFSAIGCIGSIGVILGTLLKSPFTLQSVAIIFLYIPLTGLNASILMFGMDRIYIVYNDGQTKINYTAKVKSNKNI